MNIHTLESIINVFLSSTDRRRLPVAFLFSITNLCSFTLDLQHIARFNALMHENKPCCSLSYPSFIIIHLIKVVNRRTIDTSIETKLQVLFFFSIKTTMTLTIDKESIRKSTRREHFDFTRFELLIIQSLMKVTSGYFIEIENDNFYIKERTFVNSIERLFQNQ